MNPRKRVGCRGPRDCPCSGSPGTHDTFYGDSAMTDPKIYSGDNPEAVNDARVVYGD